LEIAAALFGECWWLGWRREGVSQRYYVVGLENGDLGERRIVMER
jgi:hypothetical protein